MSAEVLNNFQKIHYHLFNAPKKGSLDRAYKKLADLEKNNRIIYHMGDCAREKVITTLAMPIFALEDVGHFFKKAIKKAVHLKADDFQYALFNCAKAILLFFTSLFAIPIAQSNPSSVYHTEESWREIKIKQVQRKIDEELGNQSMPGEKGNEIFKEALNKICMPLLNDEKQAALKKVIDSIKIPKEEFDLPASKILLVQDYMYLISLMAVNLSDITHDINLENFTRIALPLIQLRKPDLRIKIAHLLIAELWNNNGDILPWKVNDSAVDDYSQLALFVTGLTTKNPKLIKKMKEVYHKFKERMSMGNLLYFLVELESSPIDFKLKEKLLTSLIESSKKDKRRDTKNALSSIKNMNTLLATKDSEIITQCIEAPSDETFKILVQKVFDLELSKEQLDRINQLRAPWTLIVLHSRLKELTGQEREDALIASRKCFKWVADGKFTEKRHSEKDNIHLRKIFSKFPDLKKAWAKQGEKVKLDKLVPDAPIPYNEFSVVMTEDPTDIASIGVEAHNCMNLFGRLYRLKGILGFLRDGKTHVITSKDSQGKIWAEGELQLMWDKENKRPVLFLDEICCAQASWENGQHHLTRAIIEYAKNVAKETGLDLVGQYEENEAGQWIYSVHSHKPPLNRYKGSVDSLGTSSPIEYVNTYLDTINGPYTIGDVQLIYQSPKAVEPPFEAEVDGKKYVWSKKQLRSLFVALAKAKKNEDLILSDLSIVTMKWFDKVIWFVNKYLPIFQHYPINNTHAGKIINILEKQVQEDPLLKYLHKQAFINFLHLTKREVARKLPSLERGQAQQWRVQAIFNTLSKTPPAGVALNRKQVTNGVTSGLSTVMALDFVDQFNHHPIDKVKQNFQELINRQAAFQCIEPAEKKLPVLAHFHHLKVSEALNTFNLLKDTKEKLEEILSDLQDGHYLLAEEQEHALVFIKNSQGCFIFNPSIGMEQVDPDHLIDHVFEHLASNFLTYQVHKASLFRLEKGQENLHGLSPSQMMEMHNEILQARGLSRPLLKVSPFDPETTVWQTMEGISLLADYLASKNGLEEIKVCRDMEAFRKRLLQLNRSQEDFREVIIIPAYRADMTCYNKNFNNCKKESHQVPDYHSQHKVPIVLERKEGKLKICVLDGVRSDPLNMDKTYLDNHSDFYCWEQIHSYLRAAELSNATYYYAGVKRQFASEGGCDIFALRDAISFLRNPQFFEEIEKGGKLGASQTGTINNPYYARYLPPDFMRLAQSMRSLENYKEDPLFLDVPVGSHQTFEESVQKHCREDASGKMINQTIQDRMEKYQEIILKELKELTKEELEARISKRLIV